MLMALISWLALGVVIGVITTVLLMNWYNPHWTNRSKYIL